MKCEGFMISMSRRTAGDAGKAWFMVLVWEAVINSCVHRGWCVCCSHAYQHLQHMISVSHITPHLPVSRRLRHGLIMGKACEDDANGPGAWKERIVCGSGKGGKCYVTLQYHNKFRVTRPPQGQ